MDNSAEKKELGYERLIFFSDAVVAIAITLLALDLKLNLPEGHHLTFWDLLLPWKSYVAFCLSFFNIADFWQTHHLMFKYVRKMDDRMLGANLGWLFFIVVLPFSTSLISDHFTDTPALLVYCSNILLISVFQNVLWTYASSSKHNYVDTALLDPQTAWRIRLMFNLGMLNAAVAIVVWFFSPQLAFILLFFKIPLIVIASFYVAAERRKQKGLHAQ